ncbi:hypothetical protein AZE42_06775 [Rhizopogon vesiculosus]|uniref:Cytochrome P450 n=1 Tax=Rhizopogon vesiculosus TaxID=180088 RepID=A0A1J8QE31_9AGAM|nr:hypothetical protein AZE42_06775 [Rhizopogon vesiculosus]
MFPIVAAFSLPIIILGVCHISQRTRIHTTVGAVHALLEPRNTGDAADIASRIFPHAHLGLTPSSDVLNPSSHDTFVAEVGGLTASFSSHKSAEGWKELVKRADKCTERFLPRRDVDFVAFIQSVTLCTILVGFYNIDPESLSPLDIAFVTNGLNCHSDRANPFNVTELSAMMERIYRWVGGEHAPGALEIIFPAYESMWRLAAMTLDYVNKDQHMRNAFLDFSENPTERQFRAFKVKDTKPSVEAIIKEVLRLHPPMRHIMRKRKHPWWKQIFYPSQEMADIASAHRSSAYGAQPENFDAMRFHPSQPITPSLLAFGHGGLECIAKKWAPMATALIVAKVIDKVDDVRFILAGNAFETSVGHNIRTGWDGWVIRKKEKVDHTFPPLQVSRGHINPNVKCQ